MQLTDHIATFEGALHPELCDAYVKYFDSASQLGLVYSRKDLGGTKPHMKHDDTTFPLDNLIGMPSESQFAQPVVQTIWNCYHQYAERYSLLNDAAPHGIVGMRLQRTKVGGGYHVWHYENATSNTVRRIVAFSVYLNDVDVGGETEFLLQGHRATPRKGDVLLWPAGYTHPHRGNPPLSNDKYILTGWFEFI